MLRDERRRELVHDAFEGRDVDGGGMEEGEHAI
jgi:hypothetical protein